jgi:hypothetical protein
LILASDSFDGPHLKAGDEAVGIISFVAEKSFMLDLDRQWFRLVTVRS